MKKKMRIVIDSGMVLLLPLLMAYSLVGEAAHEYLGIGMFLLFIAHHILNIAWWKHLFHGRYTPLRIVGTMVNLALAIIMLALPISGMILSRHVFKFLHLGGAATGILLGTGIDEFSCRYAWSCDDGNASKEYQNAASI